MERRKAIWAASAAATTLVAASIAYAATSLLSPTPADYVGQLNTTVERPVQYVYDEVPGPAPASTPAVGVTPDPAAPVFAASESDEADYAASADYPDDQATPPTTMTGTSPSTTTVSDDASHIEHEDHATDDSRETHEPEPEPEDD